MPAVVKPFPGHGLLAADCHHTPGIRHCEADGITQPLITHARAFPLQADEEVKLLDANLQTANASMYSMQKELVQYEGLEAARAEEVCPTSPHCSAMAGSSMHAACTLSVQAAPAV